MVVLDVGANVGMFSLFIKDWAKKIYAVEPSKRIFDCLKLNTKNWHNIEIFNVGFSNRKQKTFLFGKGDETPQTMLIEGENKELIEVITIEDFFNENKISSPSKY
ncbi:MAG: FkbM family methyltransferase [Nanoarchaeota archaeon]